MSIQPARLADHRVCSRRARRRTRFGLRVPLCAGGSCHSGDRFWSMHVLVGDSLARTPKGGRTAGANFNGSDLTLPTRSEGNRITRYSFPGSAWERAAARLCLARRRAREDPRGSGFPGRTLGTSCRGNMCPRVGLELRAFRSFSRCDSGLGHLSQLLVPPQVIAQSAHLLRTPHPRFSARLEEASVALEDPTCRLEGAARSEPLLKKGTGSELTILNAANNTACEAPVEFPTTNLRKSPARTARQTGSARTIWNVRANTVPPFTPPLSPVPCPLSLTGGHHST
jgi:hypothetical protein